MRGRQERLTRRGDPHAETPRCELKEANANNIKDLPNSSVPNPLHINLCNHYNNPIIPILQMGKSRQIERLSGFHQPVLDLGSEPGSGSLAFKL